MRRHRLSASGLGRARSCLYWARTDAVHVETDSSPDALFGTAGHAACDATVKLGDRVDPLATAEAEALDDAQRETLLRVYDRWADWWHKAQGITSAWRSEVKVVWDVRSGEARLLKGGTHREYGELGEFEVPGTADLVGESDDELDVIDWKFGRMPVESPTTNPQLAHNAAALMAALGRTQARVTIAKPTEDAVYIAEPAALDVMSAEATRDELRTMIDRVPTAEPNPGPWCQWCQARAVCPATAEVVAEVVSATKLVRRPTMTLEIRDNEHAASMLTAADAVDEFIAELKKRLRAFADANGGIVMSDGSLYGRTDVTTERIDLSKPEALGAMMELGLGGIIKHAATWADIKRVHGGKELEARARATLRAMGATKVSTSPRYESKPAKKGRAA